MKKLNQDAKVGLLDRCQITGSKNLFEAINLGFQPSAGALLTHKQLNESETYYPLKLMICPESGLGQLNYIVDSKALFSDKNYVYRTGISKPLQEHLESLAGEIVKSQNIPEKSLCVDIGSNDGTLLTFFRNLGMQVLGVEPTNMAKIARKENKIRTTQDFFNESVGRDIATKYGRAKVITFTNVFAHVSSLGEVMRGIKHLMDPNGMVVSESQYLLDVFERNQFDQIYHEHVRIYSLKSLVKLFSYYDMEVFDAKRVKTREGSIRVYAGKKGVHKISPEVKNILQAEEKAGLFKPKAWERFRRDVEKSRNQFLELVLETKRNNTMIVADSCPTRGVVVMNYYGLNASFIPYIGQLPGTEKVGKFMAGTHNPIVSNEVLLKDQPEYVLILAWHFADYIIKGWREKGLKSKFIIPLPEFKIIE